VSGSQDPCSPTRAATGSPHRSPHVPDKGPGGWARTRTHTEDGRAPHRQPTRTSKEVNPMRRPSLEELQRQLEEDGGCEATEGCFVEPDGTCEHHQPSWLLALGLI
jgi:hypothetical protein